MMKIIFVLKDLNYYSITETISAVELELMTPQLVLTEKNEEKEISAFLLTGDTDKIRNQCDIWGGDSGYDWAGKEITINCFNPPSDAWFFDYGLVKDNLEKVSENDSNFFQIGPLNERVNLTISRKKDKKNYLFLSIFSNSESNVDANCDINNSEFAN